MGWLSGWSKRKKITIDCTNIDSDLSHFPLLVIIDGDTDIFGELGAGDGKKVAFTTSDGETQLYAEIEQFDASGQKAVYWVSKSGWTISSSSNTEIYIYYDSSHADNTSYIGEAGSTPAANVWDSNFVAVYHLRESGNGTSGEYKDSTSNGLDGTGGAGNASKTPAQTDGKVYKAQDFESDDDHFIRLGNNSKFDFTSALTISCWMKPESYGGGSYGRLIYKPGAYSIFWNYSDEIRFNLVIGASGKNLDVIIYETNWMYVSFTYDKTLGSNNQKALKNGSIAGQRNQTGDIDTNTNNLDIGRDGWSFDGIIDEIRFSNIDRGLAWHKFEYYNMNEADHELSWGSEEEKIVIEGTASISGGGSLSVSGEKKAYASVSISGSGSLTVSGKAFSPVFEFSVDLISEFNYIENIDEVKNHIIIEGDEYTIYDELRRILDGSEIQYTLDEIPDGDEYGKVKLTGISAGRIVVAGLDAEVTDRMFTDPTAKENIEAWRHSSDATLIDGGKIYTGSIETDKLKVGSSANQQDTLDIFQGEDNTQVFRLRSTSIDHQITQGGGEGYDWGTYTDCYFYMRKFNADWGGVHIGSFTESNGDVSFQVYAVYGDADTATDGNAKGAINLAALRGDPSTHGYQACEPGDNLFVIKSKPYAASYQALLILKQSGNLYISGSYETFQHEDDLKLIEELEDILSGKISKKEMKEKDVCKKHKVVHVSEVDEEEIGEEGKIVKTGKKRVDKFINVQAKDMLLMGAIRQLAEKNQALEKRLNKLEARI